MSTSANSLLYLEVTIGRIGSGLSSGRMSWVSLIFWKKSDQTGSGQGRVNLHVFLQIFDIFWFNWRLFDLRSGRVGSGRVQIKSNQFDFLKKLDRIGFRSERIERISQVGSDSVTSCYTLLSIFLHFWQVLMLLILRERKGWSPHLLQSGRWMLLV
jgi:hypothetical protein